MPLVTSTEMFKKAYEGHYAVGAFNVNNMEIIQGIVAAAQQEKSPLILQVSAGARKYANHIYLMKLVEAAIEDTGLARQPAARGMRTKRHLQPCVLPGREPCVRHGPLCAGSALLH